MAAGLNGEIQGDWNNRKGTHYHLVYALWLLLRGSATEVAFYQGNDLLARPSVPPTPDNTREDAIVSAVVKNADKDIWVQLKSTCAFWSPGKFLEDNLLSNFVCNALQSEHNHRLWETRLVTQGYVSVAELMKFIRSPSSAKNLDDKLTACVQHVAERLKEDGLFPVPDNHSIRDLAVRILYQLSGTKPIMLETAKAQVENELSYQCPSRLAVQRFCNMLLGAMLSDASAGPANARAYSLQWVNEITGLGIGSTELFDIDVVKACDAIIEDCKPNGWQQSTYIPRKRLESLLQQFLTSSATVFVLLGKAGYGRAWTLFHFLHQTLAGHVRFPVHGSALAAANSLDGLAADTFQGLSGRNLTNREYLRLLLAEAKARNPAIPPVVAIDDVRVSLEHVTELQGQLGRLAEQAQRAGAKLIVTCHEQTWQLYRLGREIQPDTIFTPPLKVVSNAVQGVREQDPVASDFDEKPDYADDTRSAEVSPKGRTQDFSILLDDLTLDELTEAIRQRAPADQRSGVELQIRGLDLAALRNPYLLEKYLRRHGSELWNGDPTPAPVNVDKLLNDRIEEQLERIAVELRTDLGSVRSAMNCLVPMLWDHRQTGVRAVAVESLLQEHVPSHGGNALEAFRRIGLLSLDPIEFCEKPMSDHLFAKYLMSQFRAGSDTIAQLNPDLDAGVVVTCLRMHPDPADWSQTLVRRDWRWAKPVARGLSLCSPEDFRVVAALVSLTRPESDEIAEVDACRALGILASRGQPAWDWVVEMFYDGDRQERLRAEYALTAAMELIPRKVAKAVEKRLRLEKLRRTWTSKQKLLASRDTKELEMLKRVIMPLHNITHREASHAARDVLARWDTWLRPSTVTEVEAPEGLIENRVTEVIDEIRGHVAIYEPGAISELLGELKSHNAATRYRAARALRPATFEMPERIQGGICEAVSTEQNADILHRLLWTSSRMQEVAWKPLLAALKASAVTRWDNYTSAAPALAVLGNIARFDPSKVSELLPRRLDALSGNARAYLSEVLAYAWWGLAEVDAAAQEGLTALSQPDLEGVPEDYRPLAHRGAVVAQLGLACMKRVPSREIELYRYNFRGDGALYFMVDGGDLVEKHAHYLIAGRQFTGLQEALLACVRSDEHDKVDVLNKSLRESRFFVVRDCLDILVHVARALPNPMPILNELPRSWQLLYVARHLLRRGVTTDAVVALAKEVCSERANAVLCQTSDERDLCHLELQRLGKVSQASASEKASSKMSSRIGRLFFGGNEAAKFAGFIDRQPDDLLQILDRSVRDALDLIVLHNWPGEARSWQASLISRLYARMFSMRVLRRSEAVGLVDGSLEAIRSLAESPYRNDYENTYSAIRDLLKGYRITQLGPCTATSPIERSHALVGEIIEHVAKASETREDSKWLDRFVVDRRGWWETTNLQLKDDSETYGRDLYMSYSFPAVRLALVGVGLRYGLPDPLGRYLISRRQVAEFTKDHGWIWRHQQVPQDRLEHSLAELEKKISQFPDHEGLWWRCGSILLRLGRLAEAEERLNKSLRCASCHSEPRASALYDLACVYARQGREEQCRNMLEESVELHPRYIEQLAKDPDLETVRDCSWFRQLLGETNSR
jgi:tetratricopeptide (TPR) repeat protein